jgi:glycerol kinase
VSVVLAVDAGTTGVRALAVSEKGIPLAGAYREISQHFPRPGLVEHDPVEIWEAVVAALAEVAARAADGGHAVAAIGLTNQRETVVAWDRRSGKPLRRAIVWQDRRTAARCRQLEEMGHLDLVRARTGLVLDPYFSATKAEWLLGEGGVEASPDLALGTVDAWVLWHLTGGASFATDPSNASRTLLYDIVERRWSEELCELFGVPLQALPEVRPSAGHLGRLASAASSATGLAAGTPVAGMAGDQPAALFGQACLQPGMAKATYGTGTFVLLNAGPSPPQPGPGLLASVAWDLSGAVPGDHLAYALEGSIFSTGSAIQWLRDGLGVIAEASEASALASSVPDAGGLVLVPAFTGLGSPWWDPGARGALVGVTRGTDRAHLARAALESVAHQVQDVVDAMVATGGHGVQCLRVDGGASAADLLLQLQADQLGVPVARPRVTESTALGAAYLAGLAVGVWATPAEVAACWQLDREFRPGPSRAGPEAAHSTWLQALEKARGWSTG